MATAVGRGSMAGPASRASSGRTAGSRRSSPRALILAGFLLPTLLGGADHGGLAIGYVGEPPPDLRNAISSAGQAFEIEVSIEPLADVSAAEAALGEGRVEAAIVPPAAGQGAGSAGELLVRDR